MCIVFCLPHGTPTLLAAEDQGEMATGSPGTHPICDVGAQLPLGLGEEVVPNPLGILFSGQNLKGTKRM